MGLFTKDVHSMNDLFTHQLKDIFYAEKRILGALPKMIDKASSPELKEGLRSHLEETKGHVVRLEQVFQMRGVTPATVKCPAIDGIIEEAEDVSGDVDNAQVMDAAIAASAQAVEHYEITRYGTLIAWAKELGHPECADILGMTLSEEYAADDKLTKLAEERLNKQAA
ncbi:MULTISPECIES: ferritin-like domain-containing protein [Nguyenibacter]|uniref:Ferritin-like domain-containing protein n=1 Tax=Nguyenibacter vanlangensis TaxID=1216886 RepID=A0A7Y7M7Z3_9PROT|nr:MULTISPECIES: ferritin-like domain-containing protein [Nguyenibacter]NVN12371.1 ferritin-like domain-containing protein [Nguyenibacter vanlangensis]WRH88908.1 ferritin-like domain-containing protein [Nguyenibacter sp. L1]